MSSEQKPVYVINGFLESGKTSFFTYTIGQPYFQTKGVTLVIACEEGTVGYGPKLMKATHTVKEDIDSLDEFTPAALMALDAKYNPERILIEWNGMWDFRKFRIPKKWMIEQELTTIDASTFPMYFQNGDLKSLLAEQIRGTELIMVNRCDGIDHKTLISYKRNLKAINPNAEIIFEDKDGEVDTAEAEDLPYDISRDPIELDGINYAIWFQDIFDHPDWYEGKNIRFLSSVIKPFDFPKGYFVSGRPIMGCCANDIRVFGNVVKYDGADELKDGDYVYLTAKVTPCEFDSYPKLENMWQGSYMVVTGQGMILQAEKVEPAPAPADPVLDFTNPQ